MDPALNSPLNLLNNRNHVVNAAENPRKAATVRDRASAARMLASQLNSALVKMKLELDEDVRMPLKLLMEPRKLKQHRNQRKGKCPNELCQSGTSCVSLLRSPIIPIVSIFKS